MQCIKCIKPGISEELKMYIYTEIVYRFPLKTCTFIKLRILQIMTVDFLNWAGCLSSCHPIPDLRLKTLTFKSKQIHMAKKIHQK